MVFAFAWVASIRHNSSFRRQWKSIFKHRLKLRWIGNSTSSRHRCQSLRCSCRPTASGRSCSSGKIADALVRTSPNNNCERASAWQVRAACVKRGGSQDSWVLVVAARQSECTGPWRVMNKGNYKILSKNNGCCNLSFDNWGITVTRKAKNNRRLHFVVTNEKQCRTHRHKNHLSNVHTARTTDTQQRNERPPKLSMSEWIEFN